MCQSQKAKFHKRKEIEDEIERKRLEEERNQKRRTKSGKRRRT